MVALASHWHYGLHVRSGEVDACFYFTAKPKKIGRATPETSVSNLWCMQRNEGQVSKNLRVINVTGYMSVCTSTRS